MRINLTATGEWVITPCTGCPCHWSPVIVMGTQLNQGCCGECGCPRNTEGFRAYAKHYPEALHQTLDETLPSVFIYLDTPNGLEVLPFREVCDFCSDPRVTWAYPASFVEVVPTAGNGFINASNDEWAACDSCHLLIEAGVLDDLVEHMNNQQLRLCGRVINDPDERVRLRLQLRMQVIRFMAARTGPAITEAEYQRLKRN